MNGDVLENRLRKGMTSMKLASSVSLFLVLGLLVSCTAQKTEPTPALNNPLQASRQVIIVKTPSWDAVEGTVRAYERADLESPWEPVGTEAAIALGAKGLAWGRGVHGEALGEGPVKTEGDMRSPAGVFTLGAVFGLAPRESADRFAMPYIPLDSTIECIDDPSSRYYNLIVDRRNAAELDWKSSEHMQRVGEDYAWGVVVEHNRDPRVAGKGSCIFLHIWSGPAQGTEGCTSLDEGRLLDILEWLRPAAVPMLVQLPEAEYRRRVTAWGLP
jgi:L,D-peptidoglycan transpeptidase YkuD (ErfK/YbiS/YcfS/YnhG family)